MEFGDGCPAANAEISPSAISVDRQGNVVISDNSDFLVRILSLDGCEPGTCPYGYSGQMLPDYVYTVAGDGNAYVGQDEYMPTGYTSGDFPQGTPASAGLGGLGVAIEGTAGSLIFADDSFITLLAGASCARGTCPYGYPQSMIKGHLYAIAGNGMQPPAGTLVQGVPAVTTGLGNIDAMAIDSAGDLVLDVNQSLVEVIAATSCGGRGERACVLGGTMKLGDLYTIVGGGSVPLADGAAGSDVDLGQQELGEYAGAVVNNLSFEPDGTLLTCTNSNQVVAFAVSPGGSPAAPSGTS
jgi:hypothetical protein